MKTKTLRSIPRQLAALTVLAVAGLLPTPPVQGATQRNINDWLSAQGTLDLGGFQFVPPDPNFLGWSQQVSTHNPALFANIDYAGLAAPYGTGITPSFAGNVTERPLADGRAEVSVSLRTKNANAWIVSIDANGDFFDQLQNAPALFGHRPQEVRNGAS
jgi:hypothetical protein